jgi:hypothetical protein
MSSNPTQGMHVWCLCVCVSVCAFFCVCVQVEALRQADHPSKESYLVKLSETESFMEVGQGLNCGCSAKGKKVLQLATEVYEEHTASIFRVLRRSRQV